jgi:hypothetical protein
VCSARWERGGRARGEVAACRGRRSGGGTGLAGGRGEARGTSALAAHAALATRDRGVRVASGRQRGNHARAQGRRTTSNKRGRGTRRVERRWQRRVRFSEDFSGGGRLKQRSGRHRWTHAQLCVMSSYTGGIVTSLRMH